jgi:hypothetical protein
MRGHQRASVASRVDYSGRRASSSAKSIVAEDVVSRERADLAAHVALECLRLVANDGPREKRVHESDKLVCCPLVGSGKALGADGHEAGSPQYSLVGPMLARLILASGNAGRTPQLGLPALKDE